MIKYLFVIVPIYNRLEISKIGLAYIHKSILRYERNTEKVNFKIKLVVVDDGSTDGSAEYISQTYSEVILLKGDGNLWWTGAVNLAISHVMSKYKNVHGIILQNDDIILEEDWLTNLISCIEINPNALIGCATTTKEKKDYIVYGGNNLHPWFAIEKKINYLKLRKSFPVGYVSESFDLYGRGLFIPIEVFFKLGFFNQEKFKHRGDMDIPLRAKKIGYRLLVSYDAIVYEMPNLTYFLDRKKKLNIKDLYHLLTDFRSADNFPFILNYSIIATSNSVQFIVFFISNLFFHMRSLSWRYVKQFL